MAARRLRIKKAWLRRMSHKLKITGMPRELRKANLVKVFFFLIGSKYEGRKMTRMDLTAGT